MLFSEAFQTFCWMLTASGGEQQQTRGEMHDLRLKCIEAGGARVR